MDAERATRRGTQGGQGYCRDCKEYLVKLTGHQTSEGLQHNKGSAECIEHMRDDEELGSCGLGTRRMPTVPGPSQQPSTHHYLFRLYV